MCMRNANQFKMISLYVQYTVHSVHKTYVHGYCLLAQSSFNFSTQKTLFLCFTTLFKVVHGLQIVVQT